jgi:hypothetical protein
MSWRRQKGFGLSVLLSSLLVFAGNSLGRHQAFGKPHIASARVTQERLVGTWKLVSYEVGVTHPMGRDAVGLLIYDGDGRMSLQIMRPDRPKFLSAGSKEGGYEVGSPHETMSAFRGYIAYFGTYDVKEKERFITHHIEGSLFPNWVGRDQIEFFEVSEDMLTWGLDPIRYSWKRIK